MTPVTGVAPLTKNKHTSILLFAINYSFITANLTVIYKKIYPFARGAKQSFVRTADHVIVPKNAVATK